MKLPPTFFVIPLAVSAIAFESRVMCPIFEEGDIEKGISGDRTRVDEFAVNNLALSSQRFHKREMRKGV